MSCVLTCILHLQVSNTNDPPHLTLKAMNTLLNNPLHAYIENLVPLDLTENEGFLVGDLVTQFYIDPEETSMGICVIQAQTSGAFSM